MPLRNNYSDYVVQGLQQCLRSLGYIQDYLSPPYNTHTSDSGTAILQQYHASILELIDVLHSLLHQDLLPAVIQAHSYHLPIVMDGRIGRPRFDINRDQLEYLSSLKFSWGTMNFINVECVKNDHLSPT